MTRRLVLLAVLAIGLLVTGCEGEDRQLLIDLALEWARENAVDIGAYTLWGRSGNDEVDAVMDARDVIATINGADQLMEQGRADGDLEKMQEAIELRPGDYTYRTSYATALLKSGDVAGAQAQFDASAEALGAYGEGHITAAAAQGVDELEALEPYFQQNGFVSEDQCWTYYERLAFYYRSLATEEPEAGYQGQVEYYGAQKWTCSSD